MRESIREGKNFLAIRIKISVHWFKIDRIESRCIIDNIIILVGLIYGDFQNTDSNEFAEIIK